MPYLCSSFLWCCGSLIAVMRTRALPFGWFQHQNYKKAVTDINQTRIGWGKRCQVALPSLNTVHVKRIHLSNHSQGCGDQWRIRRTALNPDLPEKLGPRCIPADWKDKVEKLSFTFDTWKQLESACFIATCWHNITKLNTWFIKKNLVCIQLVS